MATINLEAYAPAITQKSKAEEIFENIKRLNPQTEHIVIDMKNIITMTTQCARIVFGMLYLLLTADTYYQNIELRNVSEDLQTIIDMGIDHAIHVR